MKILHLNGAKGWGGNEQQLVDLIYGLNELKIHNTLCCVEGSALEKYSIENNLDFFTIKKFKYNSFSSFNILSTNIKKKSIDLIHLHTSDSILLYLLTHKIYSIEPNSIFSKKGISKSTSTLSKFKYNFSKISRIICVSNTVKENFKHVLYKKNWNKLVTVYDGINLNRLEIKLNINLKNKYVIPKTNKLIGNIANHNRAKDIETLINTANYLINELNYKNITFIQIGSFTKRTNNYKKL